MARKYPGCARGAGAMARRYPGWYRALARKYLGEVHMTRKYPGFARAAGAIVRKYPGYCGDCAEVSRLFPRVSAKISRKLGTLNETQIL